jgi:hypothetical protein
VSEGATLYLVSACGSAEEFVAAFRRYADRTGLFIPSAGPLPAGRRGRLALTLKDGGVMIEGEAEILQSSNKPTVLYGRPGMTVKFIAPDEPSKIVIGELEKARLAMKPAPSSVPPRPADVPPEPRPQVPAIGGRIDAANSLAECVVIGDATMLRDTAAAPRSINDAASSKKFIVPLIPGAPGERARTPSTPPDARPRTPSTPPETSRPKSSTVPPDPASKPVPVPTHVPSSRPLSSAASSKLTSIGFPVIDKLPAASAPVAAPAKSKFGVADDNPGLKTTLGTDAPPNATRQMSAAVASLVDEEATTIGEMPPREPGRTSRDVAAEDESTNLSSPPPVPSVGIPIAITGAAASGGTSPAPDDVAGKAPSGPVSAAPNAAIGKTPSARVRTTPAGKTASGALRTTPAGPFTAATAPSNAASAAPPSGRVGVAAASGDASAAPRAVGQAPSGRVSAAASSADPSAAAPVRSASAAPNTAAGKTPSGPIDAASSAPASAAPNAVVGKSPSSPTSGAARAGGEARASTASRAASARTPSSPVAAAKPAGILAPPPPPAPTPAPPRPPAAPLPSLTSSSTKQQQKATSIGFPVVRTPFETQPLGLVPPADPAAPVVPKADTVRAPASPAPRGKNATRPPMVPRQPTPVAPVPIVRSPAKRTPIVEDEQTEANAQQPQAAPGSPETVVAHAAYNEAAKAADAVSTSRSGGMRASEILAAIPSADWTMSPDASKPTVMPTVGWTPAAGHPVVPEPVEPTPAPSEIPQGPPTGDWTIQLDPEAPEAGWSAPAKVAPLPARAPKGGNPDIAVSSNKPIQAVEWEEKPTGIGEAKIEIDPTLMEPLTPLPVDEDESAVPLGAPPGAAGFDIGGPSPFAAPPPGGRAGTEPLAGIAALGAVMRAPSAPQPLVGSRPQSGGTPTVSDPAAPSGPATASFASAPAYSIPQAALPHTPGQQLFDPNSPAAMFGFPHQVTTATGTAPAPRRRRLLLIIGAATLALAAGFALVLLLAGNKKRSPGTAPGPGSAETMPAGGSADSSGSAGIAPAIVPPIDAGATGSDTTPAIVEPGSGATVEEPPPPSDDMCTVTVASVPTGGSIVIGKEKRGTTPADIELPCGKQVTVAVRKAKFDTADREITPHAGKPTKLTLKLLRPSVMVKVTSSPAGATITVRGKSMGVTPARIRLTANVPASIVLSKPGYTTDTTKLTPKGNSPSHHATLKKSGKR